jgi:acetoin utilization protein AcuB
VVRGARDRDNGDVPVLVRDVMTPAPRSIDAGADTLTAAHTMEIEDVRHLLVMSEGELVGVLSKRELGPCRRMLTQSPGDVGPPVDALCVPDPLVVLPDDPLDRVTEEMALRRVGSAIVVDDGKPIGIVTTTDVCIVLTKLLRGEL